MERIELFQAFNMFYFYPAIIVTGIIRRVINYYY